MQVLNVLCLLETVALLLSQASEELGKDANVVANQTILAQVLQCLEALANSTSFSSFASLIVLCSLSLFHRAIY